jgi:serine protease Do
MTTPVRLPASPSTFALVLSLGALGAGCGHPTAHPGAGSPIGPEPPPSPVGPSVSQPGQSSGPGTPVPATFDVAALAERVKPAVVSITTTSEVRVPGGMEGGDPFEFFFGPRGPRQPDRSMKRSALGSGFIIDPSGYVVTNEHVVHEADDVRVHLADDRELPAEVVGRDPKLDLALLKVKGASSLPYATLGSSERTRVGESVLAVGNPFGLGHTVTLGIVSAKARTIGAGPYDDFIQTDASINPGNSGGPLFNWKGEVIGINTAIRAGANGIGFAIPSDALKDVLPQLREKGYVERGKVGIAFQPVTPELARGLGLSSPEGALVAEVEPNGPAARAGIRPRDVIVAVDGNPIRHAEELPRNVARHAPGATITLTYLRGDKRLEAKTTLDALQDDEARAVRPGRGGDGDRKPQATGRFGITVSDGPGGARVDSIAEGSKLEDVRPGDVITELDGAPVKNAAELAAALGKAKPGTTVVVKVKRGPLTRYAALPVPEK